jgi:hypothetical protein
MKKNYVRCMSAMLAFVIPAFALTACSGNNDSQVSQQSSTVSITSEQNVQLNSLIGSFFNKSSSEETSSAVSNAEPSYSQSSVYQPSYTQPSYTQPSYAQPSYTQPSYAQPSYTQSSVYQYSQITQTSPSSIKTALEADMGLDKVVEIYGGQFAGANMTVRGEYEGEDKIVFYMQLKQYVDTSQSAVASAIKQMENQFNTLDSQMAASIANLESQYNVRPFEMEFRFCNGDGSVIFSKSFTDNA